MITVERHPGVVLRYNWKLAGIKKDSAFLSKKIKYKGNDSFRIGFKNPSPYTSPTLLFLTTNLNKIGLKATDVSFSSSKDPKMKNMELKVGREEDENWAIQLFTASLLKLVGSACSFILKVHLAGIVENYRISPIDRLLSQQLWSSNQDSADFELVARDGKSFRVHKWILAARSPVFAALFSKEKVKQTTKANQKNIKTNHVLDCNTLDEMKQFIKFIYTGEFEQPVSGSEQARQLAVKYQVTVMEHLNHAASENITVDKLATLAFHFLPGNDEPLCEVDDSK